MGLVLDYGLLGLILPSLSIVISTADDAGTAGNGRWYDAQSVGSTVKNNPIILPNVVADYYDYLGLLPTT